MINTKQAYVALDTVCWPGDLDIAPETLIAIKLPDSRENINNQDFKGVEFDSFRNAAGSNSFTLGERAMPAISMFYGIIICLYFYDNERHKLPHIHAKYQGQEAAFSILDGAVLNGEIPLSKSRLVQAWIEIHREALLADWELAVSGQTPFAIDPLR